MFNNDDEFLTALSLKLINISEAWFGHQAKQVIFEKKIERRFSFLLHVRVGFPQKPDQSLVIKIPRMPSMTKLVDVVGNEKIKREAKMEAEILGRTFQRIQNSEHKFLTAIRVYGHFPEFCAIVMEELPFEVLKNEIIGFRIPVIGRKNWQMFLENVGRSGIWLRLFHEDNWIIVTEKLRDTQILDEIDTAFKRLETVSGLDLTIKKDQLHQVFESVGDEAILVAILHNDFHLGNVFITQEGKIGAFDPNWERSGPILIDIARIVIDLETRRFQVLTFGCLLSQGRNYAYKRALLNGYFQNSSVKDSLIGLFCAFELVKKWRVNEEFIVSQKFRRINFLKPLITSWSRLYFKHLINQYLSVG